MTLLRNEEKQLFADYKQIFGSAVGKRVLDDLIYRFHMLDPVFDHENRSNTDHNEGERNVVLYILWRLRFEEAEFRHHVLADEGE